jgi:hypothetical protein
MWKKHLTRLLRRAYDIIDRVLPHSPVSDSRTPQPEKSRVFLAIDFSFIPQAEAW